MIKIKGDLFATALSFSIQVSIRLGSSMILTRILLPDAYGVITVLTSVVSVLEMLGDLGFTMFIIRDKRGEEDEYLQTAWTLRLGRAVLNSAILLFLAPKISLSLYHVENLTTPLRVVSLLFLIGALQSMSFPLANRHKKSYILMYAELGAAFLSSCFSVVYCFYSRDYWGILYGMLFNKVLTTTFSYQIYKEFRPRLSLDRTAAREMLHFSKFVVPSSILTLSLTQFDKVVFLKLFDLSLLGVYGLAGNISTAIESLIIKISQVVLFPRCADNYRRNLDTYAQRYYSENIKLFGSILFLPAAVGGAAHLLISILYDSRYAAAASVLQAFMLRAAILSLATPAEDLLFVAGETRLFLLNEILRSITVFAGSLIGYYFFGFLGFTYGIGLSGLPSLVYFLWLQQRRGFLIVRFEVLKLAYIIAVAVAAYITSSLILAAWPAVRIRF